MLWNILASNILMERFKPPAESRLPSMSLSNLTAAQQVIVHQCMRICAERRDMFPDWEFQTIFGVTRDEMACLVSHWPDIDERVDKVRHAINNAMNNMLGYPHGHHEDWDRHFPFGPRELFETFSAWKGSRPKSYFEGWS